MHVLGAGGSSGVTLNDNCRTTRMRASSSERPSYTLQVEEMPALYKSLQVDVIVEIRAGTGEYQYVGPQLKVRLFVRTCAYRDLVKGSLHACMLVFDCDSSVVHGRDSFTFPLGCGGGGGHYFAVISSIG